MSRGKNEWLSLDEKAALVAMLQAGCTTREAMDRFNLSDIAVGGYRKKFGIKSPKAKPAPPAPPKPAAKLPIADCGWFPPITRERLMGGR